MTRITDDERAALAALTYLAEPGEPKLNALIAGCGPQEVLDAIGRDRLPALPYREAGPADLERWRSRLGAVPSGNLPDRFAEDGIRIICPGDAEWPRHMHDMGGTYPYALWVHGSANLAEACDRSLSVTGIRPASDQELQLAYSAGTDAAARGRTVISGAATGTDTAAHRGALDGGGRTIVVLPCGLGRPHPRQHELLTARAAETGAVVSELPPGHLAGGERFARRCTILTAMTTHAVVIGAQPGTPEYAAVEAGRHLHKNLMNVPAGPDPGTWAETIGRWLPGPPWGALRLQPASGTAASRPARAPRRPGPGETRRGRH